MTNYNEEYFLLRSRGSNIPILEYTGNKQITNSQLAYSKEAISVDEIIPLKYSRPFINNAQLADINFISFNIAISEKLMEHLNKIKLKNVQFIPAIIKDYSDEIHEGYYIIHVHNLIKCADLEQSIWIPSSRNPNRVLSFENLVLDNEALEKVPLEDRLVIALKEKNLYHIYHRSVVDHILQIRPTGVAFYPLSGFTGREPFEDAFLDYILSE